MPAGIRFRELKIFLIFAGFFLFSFSNALALTVSGIDGTTVCPFRNAPQKCVAFFKSVSLINLDTNQQFIDDSLDKAMKQTELGYIPKGSNVKIQWSDYGNLKNFDHYYLRYACADTKQNLLSDNIEIYQYIYDREKNWTVPKNFDWYKIKNACYCKIWIGIKGKGSSNDKAANLGEANTRPFRICPIEKPPAVETLDPDYSKITLDKAIIEGNLKDLGINEDRLAYENNKSADVWFEYRYVSPRGNQHSGTAIPDIPYTFTTGKFVALFPEKIQQDIVYEFRAVADNKLHNGKGTVYGTWKNLILSREYPPVGPEPGGDPQTPCGGGSKNVLFIPSNQNEEIAGTLPIGDAMFKAFNFANMDFGALAYKKLKKYDTIVLQPQSCNAESNLGAQGRESLKRFVEEGGKLIIYDAKCGYVNRFENAFYLWLGDNGFSTYYPGGPFFWVGKDGKPSLLDWNKNQYPYINLSAIGGGFFSDVVSQESGYYPNYIDTEAIASQTNAAGAQSFIEPAKSNVWCANLEGQMFYPENKGTFGVSHAFSFVNNGKGIIIYNGLARDNLKSFSSPKERTGVGYLAKIFLLELKQVWGERCNISCVKPINSSVILVKTLDFELTSQDKFKLRGEVLSFARFPNIVNFEIAYKEKDNDEIIPIFSTKEQKFSSAIFVDEIPLDKALDVTGKKQYFFRAVAQDGNKKYNGSWKELSVEPLIVTLSPASDITESSAKIGVKIIKLGPYASLTSSFRVWSENKM